MKPVCVVGAGAWGSAIATVLARNNIPVYLWSYEDEVVQEIAQQHTNSRYLPQINLSKLIIPIKSFDKIIQCTWIFQATPIKFLREITLRMKPYIRVDHQIIMLSKGIEQSSLLLPVQLTNEILGHQVARACLMGPSFAYEVAREQLTGTVLASKDLATQQRVRQLLENDYFKIQLSLDVQGVQLASALKNVIALGYGIFCGAGYSQNTNAWYVTQLFQEVSHLILVLQGSAETTYGLAGFGDVILTTFGTHSKNLTFGKLLGQGSTFLQAQDTLGFVPEGVNTAGALRQLLHKNFLNYPLLDKTIGMIFGEITPQQLLLSL